MLALDHLALCAAGCFPHQPWLGPVITALPPDAHPDPDLDIHPDVDRGINTDINTDINTGIDINADIDVDVALTFDDGPDPDVTPRVAEMLESRGLRASFFVIGERAARHPELIKGLVDAGHRIENHTATHPSSFAFSFLPRLGREIGECQRTVSELTERAPAYFRAPAGMRNPLLEIALARQGLHLVSWTKRGYDTADGDADRVFRRLDHKLRRGDILLLHDGNAARTAAGRAVCLDVLPRLLDRLDEVGLKAGALPELPPLPS